MTVGRGAVQLQCFKPLGLQTLNDVVGVQRYMHGIACVGMRQLKLQVGSCGQAVPGATQCDARIGKTAQTVPRLTRIGSDIGAHGALFIPSPSTPAGFG